MLNSRFITSELSFSDFVDWNKNTPVMYYLSFKSILFFNLTFLYFFSAFYDLQRFVQQKKIISQSCFKRKDTKTEQLNSISHM